MSKTITRKYIQRITKHEGNTSTRQSGGGGGGGGGVSQYWVDDNYVSKEFFNRLFEIHDENGDPILPNDVETEIDNIQAMFGFWTNAYLSALGQNEGGGGVELTLASLADVAVQGVADGQALVWSASQGKWVPGEGGGGLDPTAMWAELATTGTQQINATHLTTALTGYATQTWVGQNYLGLHATADAAAQLSTARTLWGQSFDGTANVSGAITDATTITASSNVLVGGTLGVTGATTLSSTLSVSGNATLGGDILMNSGGRIHIVNEPSGASLYIGNSNDAGWVYMSDMCSRQGDGYWKIQSNGNSEFANVSVGGTLGVTGAATLSSTLSVSGNATLGGDILMSSGGRIHIANEPSKSSLYIGNSNDAGWVYMSDMCSRQGDGYWKVYSNGNSEFANVYSRGYVTALSDVRHKDIQGDVGLTVREIANAPSVKFLWKDRRQEGMQVGSIAQYWQKVMPEAVLTGDKGELTMSYGVIALLASIANAREIVNLKREIAELKRKLQIN